VSINIWSAASRVTNIYTAWDLDSGLRPYNVGLDITIGAVVELIRSILLHIFETHLRKATRGESSNGDGEEQIGAGEGMDGGLSEVEVKASAARFLRQLTDARYRPLAKAAKAGGYGVGDGEIHTAMWAKDARCIYPNSSEIDVHNRW
jgi:hypothetical protein